MADQICLENSCAGSTQVFKIKARLRVKTTSRLKDLIITDESYCEDAPTPPPPEKDEPLHLVVLMDTSDSFNKLGFLTGTQSEAGSVAFDKWLVKLLKKVNFSKRTGPITLTVIQFSGMGPDKNYIPGSNGFADKNGVLRHYKIELGPLFASQLSRTESHLKINQLLNVDSIDGNGQLYLALQDISMANFTAQLDKAARVAQGTKSKRILVVMTDDEWDLTDLPLAKEVTDQSKMVKYTEKDKKRAILDFARKKYDSISFFCVQDKLEKSANEVTELFNKRPTDNVFMVPEDDMGKIAKDEPSAKLERHTDSLLNFFYTEYNL